MELESLVDLALVNENSSDIAESHGPRALVAEAFVYFEFFLMELESLVDLPLGNENSSDVTENN